MLATPVLQEPAPARAHPHFGSPGQSAFDAVLFDCDGVLVDSEPITKEVLREMLTEMGWAISSDECMGLFIGKAPTDEAALIEQRTGHRLTEPWIAEFRRRRNEALERELLAVPNIHQAVHAAYVHHGGRIACASGSDRRKLELQLEKVSLMRYFDGRIFSGPEMKRSKPAPDVYLAAAQALGVSPQRCVVIEDTVTGVTAGAAAGALVFAYNREPIGDLTPRALLNAGATLVFHDMAELPSLVCG
ncbi:HAD family phosphatase [Hydrogenophaga sp.]|uniref:HAD family hydrolase n=1 Tax=Hydrogenophaga sp. TaxID=1904254 RepID=UPI002614695F|nr:HAD family phosphatase [Hydrogenophaga sp.]MCW5654852.1 HAD family phosphatase [Hydrogenophaga sp.]